MRGKSLVDNKKTLNAKAIDAYYPGQIWTVCIESQTHQMRENSTELGGPHP